MYEKHIEKRFRKAVMDAGGLALKFVSPGWDGAPDRIVLMPGGKMCFAELKAPGRKMRALQLRRKKQLEELGFRVFCIDTAEQIRGVTDEIRAT